MKFSLMFFLSHDWTQSHLNVTFIHTHSSCCCCEWPGWSYCLTDCCPPCWGQKLGWPGQARLTGEPQRQRWGCHWALWRWWVLMCCQCTRPPVSVASCLLRAHSGRLLYTCKHGQTESLMIRLERGSQDTVPVTWWDDALKMNLCIALYPLW